MMEPNETLISGCDSSHKSRQAKEADRRLISLDGSALPRFSVQNTEALATRDSRDRPGEVS